MPLDSVDYDLSNEAEVRDMLYQYYAPSYKERIDSYLDQCLAIEPFRGRFEYLFSVIGEDVTESHPAILVSGFGMGGEMIIARQFGFGKVYGVEVDQILVDVTKKRLQNYPDMYPAIYDGKFLPYEDGEFYVVASGHVIEHTEDPSFYLQEVLRVLVPGGYLMLEFPDRYHRLELHTQLPSFEWLPRKVRNFVLRVISSKNSPLNEDVKSRYESIVNTNLQQISAGGVKRMLQKTQYSGRFVNKKLPAPGYVRCVIQRTA
jgi:SAM-dependent methyltransferase